MTPPTLGWLARLIAIRVNDPYGTRPNVGCSVWEVLVTTPAGHV